MDWSLALVSQGIETTIVFSEEAGWGLIVPAQDHEHALEVIRLYRTENLHWPWRKRISKHDYLFDWGAVAWVFLISKFFWLDESIANLHGSGVMSADAVSHGEWWRLFTAIFLHANPGHLAANASIGLVLLGLAMGAYGTGVGLFAAFLAGVGGNVLRLIFSDGHPSLGASGMVMGALGLLAVQSVSELTGSQIAVRNSRADRKSSCLSNKPDRTLPLSNNRSNAWKYIFSAFAAGVMLFVLLGTSPDSDVTAHFGGFISGVLIGTVLMLKPPLTQSKKANIVAGALFCFVVILAWWSALNGAE